MQRLVLFSVVCVSFAMAMTTTHAPHHSHHPHTHRTSHSPRPSQEPGEHENFKFMYEPHSQMMIVVVNRNCYVFSLTDSEKAAVHTDAGIRAIELKMIGQLKTASVTEVTKDQLDTRTAHACAMAQHFYKENVV